MKKFVIDANEHAREKALDAVLAFVEEAQLAGK
jgi:cytoskeleton-associated protein 5